MKVTLKTFFLITSLVVVQCSDRIKLQDVEVLTLYAGRYTNGRRSAPVPQLECIGGSKGCEQYAPTVVQCYNKGSDGYDVQWKCEGNMDKRFTFGRIEVNCEGYDYPNDPYILKGSCGLRYTLVETGHGGNHSSNRKHHSTTQDSFLTNLLFIGAVVVVIYLIYVLCIKQSDTSDRHPDVDASAPPPPGFRPEYTDPPPSYEQASYSGPSSSGAYRRGPRKYHHGSSPTPESGPGFWSGAAMGGVMGYLFGNSGDRQTPYYGTGHRSSGGWFSSGPSYSTGYCGESTSTRSSRARRSSSSGSNGGTHTATGFGGTTRR